MQVESTPVQTNDTKLCVALGLSASIITLFLTYIDEGYYSFDWVKNPRDWITFSVFVLVIFLSKLFVFQVLLKKISVKRKVLVNTLLDGIFVSLILFGILS